MSRRPLRHFSLTLLFLLLALALLGGCAPSAETTPAETAEAPAETAEAPPPTAPVKDAPEIIHQMIAAHGGLEVWNNAPSVYFEEHFMAADAEQARVTHITVEQGQRRVYMDIQSTGGRAAWDGEKVWSVDWGMPLPPRFWAQLNFYFFALPWLTMDPGVYLEDLGMGKLWDDEEAEYHVVNMTFGEGVGDTAEDYYKLFIDPETHQLAGARYIVTYKAILPEGAEASPENVLVFEGTTEVDGLLVPSRYQIYRSDKVPYVSTEAKNWSFTKPFDASLVEMPEGAVVDESTP